MVKLACCYYKIDLYLKNHRTDVETSMQMNLEEKKDEKCGKCKAYRYPSQFIKAGRKLKTCDNCRRRDKECKTRKKLKKESDTQNEQEQVDGQEQVMDAELYEVCIVMNRLFELLNIQEGEPLYDLRREIYKKMADRWLHSL